MITQVPELYDGGYWYVVGAKEVVEDGETIATVPFAEFVARYSGSDVRVRVVAPIPTPAHQATAVPGKFFARIGGR